MAFLVDIGLVLVVASCIFETAGMVDADIGFVVLFGRVDGHGPFYFVELKGLFIVVAAAGTATLVVAGSVGFVDTGIFLIGEKFELLQFVEIGLFFSVGEASTGDNPVLICFHQRRDDIADIHGIVFGVVLVLLGSRLDGNVVILLCIRTED